MYYKSRYHLTNGTVSVALDSLTGEVLELAYEKTGENLIKNHSYTLPQPFAVVAGTDTLRPGDVGAVRAHPELAAKITVADDGRSARVHYASLWDGSRVREVEAEYSVDLGGDPGDTVWKLTLHCGDGESLTDVQFPCLNGIYLGETWEDDTLVYPRHAGFKIVNPVTAFAAQNHSICWRWQEYNYVYAMGSPAGKLSETRYGVQDRYTGALSMKWLDYYGEDFGLYFASHETEYQICALRADTLGPTCPGMNFSVWHPLSMQAGDTWETPEVVAALHAGDWHAGADKYRAFHRTFTAAETAEPEWFKKSAGLIAHYDLKYQNGGVVHKYDEIEGLLSEAREMGLNHLLLAGWHHDGFDNGFPMYVPDDDLGTEDDLRSAVHAVTEKGGHICFYINARIGNKKYDQLHGFYEENGVRLRDGSIMTETYGNSAFAVHCPGSRGWREKLLQTSEYVTEDIGIDGIYFDQLAMGDSVPCTNPDHDHKFGEWNKWYQKLLGEIREGRKARGEGMLSMIHEGCSDAYGGFCSGQLVSTFFGQYTGSFPELYRYTFPEQTLVDMLYPARNLAMRPVHVAQASRTIMDRAFVTGMYYWIYDLKDDNTFTRDPDSYEYLKAMISLRTLWLEKFGKGSYRDTVDLVGEIPQGVCAATYELDGRTLLVCANRTGQAETIQLKILHAKKAQVFTSENQKGSAVQTETLNGVTTVRIPSAPLSVTCIEQ